MRRSSVRYNVTYLYVVYGFFNHDVSVRAVTGLYRTGGRKISLVKLDRSTAVLNFRTVTTEADVGGLRVIPLPYVLR